MTTELKMVRGNETITVVRAITSREDAYLFLQFFNGSFASCSSYNRVDAQSYLTNLLKSGWEPKLE